MQSTQELLNLLILLIQLILTRESKRQSTQELLMLTSQAASQVPLQLVQSHSMSMAVMFTCRLGKVRSS
jgi:hypothetical protein